MSIRSIFLFFFFAISITAIPAVSFGQVSRDQMMGFKNDWARAYVQSIDSSTQVTAISSFSEFKIGEILVVQSKDGNGPIIGFLQVYATENQNSERTILKTKLIRHSKYAMIQLGDVLYRMDFNTFHHEYTGTTELILKNNDVNASASYKALTFMGLSSGETAQTLRGGELLFNVLGYFDYGFTSNFSVGTLILADVVGSANIHGKYKFYESESNIFSFGAGYLTAKDKPEGVVNATVYWDSVSSESVISHTNLTIALATFDRAKNLTAIKGAGSSSFQSGYEFVMDDWNRILAGPSYNFENKSVGGYVS
ncbi:MAG: hypothetical protein H7326_02230, partial [Bdellovibrionaceae bacterium]|nr:hypothetical protein [Pseudobdellovibrionaceae bacterium]